MYIDKIVSSGLYLKIIMKPMLIIYIVYLTPLQNQCYFDKSELNVMRACLRKTSIGIHFDLPLYHKWEFMATGVYKLVFIFGTGKQINCNCTYVLKLLSICACTYF